MTEHIPLSRRLSFLHDLDASIWGIQIADWNENYFIRIREIPISDSKNDSNNRNCSMVKALKWQCDQNIAPPTKYRFETYFKDFDIIWRIKLFTPQQFVLNYNRQPKHHVESVIIVIESVINYEFKQQIMKFASYLISQLKPNSKTNHSTWLTCQVQ